MTAHRPVICQDCRLIGDIDTLIAATAFEQNLTILTIDRDCERVPHLPVIGATELPFCWLFCDVPLHTIWWSILF